MLQKEQVLYDLQTYVHRKQELQQKKIARDSYTYGGDGVYSADKIKELTREIDEIQVSLDKIDHAVSKLSPTERIVVQAMYTLTPLPVRHRKPYRILAHETQYAEGTLRNARASALKKLGRML